MKSLLALSAVLLLGMGATGCDGSSKGGGSTPSSSVGLGRIGGAQPSSSANVAPAQLSLKRDIDNDRDSATAGVYDGDDNDILAYGQAAGVADEKAVVAVVRRYYHAAAAGNGVRACSLIYSLFAEAVAEGSGNSPVPSSLREACAVAASKLFKQRRRQLVTDSAALKVTGMRVEGNRGYALLGFGRRPERYILMHRESGAWKLNGLFDSGLP